MCLFIFRRLITIKRAASFLITLSGSSTTVTGALSSRGTILIGKSIIFLLMNGISRMLLLLVTNVGSVNIGLIRELSAEGGIYAVVYAGPCDKYLTDPPLNK